MYELKLKRGYHVRVEIGKTSAEKKNNKKPANEIRLQVICFILKIALPNFFKFLFFFNHFF